MKQMKVYIAAPFFDEEQLALVQEVENLLAENNIIYFSPRLEGVIKDMSETEKAEKAKHMYLKNIAELIQCNVMIAFVDYKDTGTIFELGYSARLKEEIFNKDRPRKIITFSNKSKSVNLMLKYAIDSHCKSFDELDDLISGIAEGIRVSNNNNLVIDE